MKLVLSVALLSLVGSHAFADSQYQSAVRLGMAEGIKMAAHCPAELAAMIQLGDVKSVIEVDHTQVDKNGYATYGLQIMTIQFDKWAADGLSSKPVGALEITREVKSTSDEPSFVCKISK